MTDEQMEGVRAALYANLRIEPVPNRMYDWQIAADSIDDAAQAVAAAYNPDERLRDALEAIGSQAICYGMRADETELRDWLKFISETAESALSPLPQGDDT